MYGLNLWEFEFSILVKLACVRYEILFFVHYTNFSGLLSIIHYIVLQIAHDVMVMVIVIGSSIASPFTSLWWHPQVGATTSYIVRINIWWSLTMYLDEKTHG